MSSTRLQAVLFDVVARVITARVPAFVVGANLNAGVPNARSGITSKLIVWFRAPTWMNCRTEAVA